MSAITQVTGIFNKVIQAPLLVKAGAGCGAIAGLTLGFMVSAPVGILLGVVFGSTVGVVSGIVMDRDERRSTHRTRELDDIIGVTSGSMGTTRSERIERLEELDIDAEVERERELESWVAEWLTPPAPGVSVS